MASKEDLVLRWIAGDEDLLLEGRAAPSEVDARVLDRLRDVLSNVLPRARELRIAEDGDVPCGFVLGFLPQEETEVCNPLDRLGGFLIYASDSPEMGVSLDVRGPRALAAAGAFMRDFPDAQVTDGCGYPLLCFESGRGKDAARPVTLNELRAREGKTPQLQFFFAPKAGA